MGTLRHAYDVLSSSGMNEGLPADNVAKLLCESQRCADMSKRFKAYYLVEMDERRLYQTFGCSLPNALLSRFGLCERLVRYEDDAIARIASRSAAQLGLQLTIGAALVLAQRARGIPRQALSLLGRVHENAICDGTDVVNSELVLKTLTRLGYDADGHTPDEQQYLRLLARSRGAMPLHRLCSLLGEGATTVTKTIEPHLFEAGLVATSRAGRRLVTPAIGGGAWRVRERTRSLRPTRSAQAPRASLQV